MKIDYQKELDKEIQKISQKNSGIKPKLLLHACCGPCSSYVLEYLSNFFEITVYFYNPNIYPKEEYERRLNELKTFYLRFPVILEKKINFIEEKYFQDEFYNAIKIKENPELANEKEKGERCRRCYEFRLKKAAMFAVQNDFDYFCTTLSISPFKDSEKINKEGQKIADNIKAIKWLFSDFKKKNGFKRSLELSEQYGLYRQEYCGCFYSVKNK